MRASAHASIDLSNAGAKGNPESISVASVAASPAAVASSTGSGIPESHATAERAWSRPDVSGASRVVA